MIIPHVALWGLVSQQQVSVHLIYKLRSDPTQRHIHLICGHVVIILTARGESCMTYFDAKHFVHSVTVSTNGACFVR